MQNKKSEQRALLQSLLGELPDRFMPVEVQTLKVEKIEGGTLELLRFKYPDEPAFQGYFVLPENRSGKVPAILYNHSHGSLFHLGKDELLQGAPYQNGPYLPDLLKAGYAVLTIDHRAFGSRSDKIMDDIFKEMLWNGQVLWGMMLYDTTRALDYLCSREEVDPDRIGTVGMSMGSTMAWYIAAMDDRIKVCADICCMTDFEELIKAKHLSGHGMYYFVPRLLKYFDTASINALIAPRPHLSVNGRFDGLTPEAGLDKVDAALKEVYLAAGVPEKWKLLKYPAEHEELPEMRQEVLAFFRQYL